MAVIVSSNFYYRYTIPNQPYFHTHNPTKFHLSSRNSNFSPLHHHQNRRLCACQSSSKPNNYEAEEQRWLREEKRWLREEQRWLREEARWNNERQSLLRQISELSLQIQHLQSELDNFRKVRSDSVDYDVDFVAQKTAELLQAKFMNQISEFSDDKSFSELQTTRSLEDSSPGDDDDSVSSPESKKNVEEEKKQKSGNASSILRVGAEGEEVRALQEALMNLGFYSGEEDMEFSSFSSGTERAVKTWQSSIGFREDGIMTIELLERLFAQTKSSSPPTPSVNDDVAKDEANGAPVSVKNVQQTVVKKEPTDVGIPEHRVFLLGENRWEEPYKMNKGNDKLGTGVKAQPSTPKCLVCRGEGRLLCMECDGTGDPNIEEQQFVDWMEEGAKCPYCEGLGYTICDVCDGKPVV